MKKLIFICLLALISCNVRTGVIFEKQGYYIRNIGDTMYKYKVRNNITESYEIAYKYGKFNIGDKIDYNDN